MICRLFTGSVTVDGKTIENARFTNQGKNGILYVIDEIAIKNIYKHRSIGGVGGSGEPVSVDDIVAGEFRRSSGYGFDTFLDKVVKPVHMKSQIGVYVEFPDDPEQLKEFAKHWRVQVDMPPNAVGIATPAWGFLVPALFTDKPPSEVQYVLDVQTP